MEQLTAEQILTKSIKKRQTGMFFYSFLITLLGLGFALIPNNIFYCFAAFFIFIALIVVYFALTRFNPKNSLLLGGSYRNWQIHSIKLIYVKKIYWVNFIIPIPGRAQYQLMVYFNNSMFDEITIDKQNIDVISEYLHRKIPGKFFTS